MKIPHGIGRLVVTLSALLTPRKRVSSTSIPAWTSMPRNRFANDHATVLLTIRYLSRFAFLSGKPVDPMALRPSAAPGSSASKRRKNVLGRM